MTKEALKLQNQPTIDIFKKTLGDITPLAEFMPKTSHDIISFINYWQMKKTDPSSTTWTVEQCDKEILALEKLMLAGRELATDLLQHVDIQQVEQRYPEEELVTDRSKLPSTSMIRDEIKRLYKEEGQDAAEKYGRAMLNKNNNREGSVFLPEAVPGIIATCIKEAQEAIAELPEEAATAKEKSKAESTNVESKQEDPYAELKKRYPSLGENITDEECLLIDTYEKRIKNTQAEIKKEEARVFELAKKGWLKLKEEEKEDIRKRALSLYKDLPSEDKATFTEEQYTIAYYGSTLKIDPKTPITDFCTEKETVEEEQKAMKDIQERVSNLLKENKPNEARALGRLFFGAFNPEKLWKIERGRAWSDAEVEFWLKWVKDGCAEGEWHNYKLKVKEEDEKRDVEVAQAKKEGLENKYNNLEMPAQLKEQISQVIEANIKNKVKLDDTNTQCEILCKEHDHPFNKGEIRTLYTWIKTNVVETPKEEKEGPSEKVFVREAVKKLDPVLWKKAKGIKSLGDLHKFLREHKDLDWKVGLNLVFDFKTKIDVTRNWADARMENWYHKAIAKFKEEKPKAEPSDLEADLQVLKKSKGQKHFKEAIGKILKKYGTTLNVKEAIANTMSTLTSGWPKQMSNQPDDKKIEFINGIIKWFKLDKQPTAALS